MRRLKVYLDTSVISHLYAPDVPDKMNNTLALWEEIKSGLYEVYISEITVKEIINSDEPKKSIMVDYLSQIEYNFIEIDNEIMLYADKLNEMGILTDKHYDDCLHIASAVVNECNYLLSWNFKHIVRVKTINGVRSINAILGYHGIDIYSPNLLIESED